MNQRSFSENPIKFRKLIEALAASVSSAMESGLGSHIECRVVKEVSLFAIVARDGSLRADVASCTHVFWRLGRMTTKDNFNPHFW